MKEHPANRTGDDLLNSLKLKTLNAVTVYWV
jgi:hypothetical protein